MSLQVWLPFNGSFENQGCGDYVITENSSSKVAYDDNGKIGKCKKAGQLKINKNPLGLNGTIAFWIWIDENYDRAGGVTLFGNNDTNAKTTNRKWSLHLHPNNYSLHSWGCQKDDANTANSTWTVNDCFTANQWHHATVAHDEQKQYIYIDGVLKQTVNWSSSGKFTFDVETVLSYPHGGEGGVKINDLRLYDHCLSKAEVQELAKGLICHIPMNHSGFGNYNLVSGTATWSNWYNQQAGELAEEGVWTLNLSTQYPNYMRVAATSGEEFTIGIDVKADENFTTTNGIILFQFFNSSGSRLSYFWGAGDFTTDWVRHNWTITIPSNSNITHFCVGLRAADGKKVYFRKLKIERGKEVSPWSYSAGDMGLDWAIEKDISGYGYDGTLNNGVIYSTQSAVGQYCAKFEQNKCMSIQTLNPPYIFNNENLTISFWMKWKGIFEGQTYSSFLFSCETAGALNKRLHVSMTADGYLGFRFFNNDLIRTGFSFLDHLNEWFFVTCVLKDGSRYIYVNGEMVKSDTPSSWIQLEENPIITIGSNSGKNSNFFNGDMDDFRIYSTALSDENIKQLYEAKARINKNGTMFCNKYIENENDISTNIEKTSILNTQKVSEQLKLYDMETTVLDDGSVWARVFYHNCHGGTVLFTSLSECRNTQTEDKYSRLAFIDEFRGEDGKFEFMLRYPTDTDKYNRWKQLNNPCDEYVERTSTGEGVAEGYEPIHIDWSVQYWGGLTRQNSSETSVSSCYLSGSVGHSNWHYAIGATSTHGNGIPTANSSTANDVEIWIRIDNAFIDRKNICPTSFDDWEERRI